MATAVEPEAVSKLGLADLDPAELPHLEVVVRNAKHDIVANVGAQIVALIVSPQNRVLYLEAISTSDAGAHALMASVSDPSGAVEFCFYRVGDGDYFEIQPPESLRSQSPFTTARRSMVGLWCRKDAKAKTSNASIRQSA